MLRTVSDIRLVKTSAAVGFGILLSTSVCVRAQMPGYIPIQGIVRDQRTQLVGAATITAVGQSAPATSNPNGMFQIFVQAAPGAMVSLQITKPGYQGAFQPVAAVPGIPYVFILLSAAPSQDTTTAFANTFQKVDVIYREVNAFHAGVKPGGPTQNAPFALKAVQRGNEIDFENGGYTVSKITTADIQRLPQADQQYIVALERSMTNYFTTWTNLYPARSDGSVTPDKLKEIDAKLQVAGFGMCDNLQHILLFLGQLNLVLQDHYMSVRTVCQQFQSDNAGSVGSLY
jgi:hypothetical protein